MGTFEDKYNQDLGVKLNDTLLKLFIKFFELHKIYDEYVVFFEEKIFELDDCIVENSYSITRKNDNYENGFV